MSLKNITVGFYVYPTAFQNPGGGEIQLLKTKEYLEKEGMQVRLFDTWKDSVNHFDIIHVFGSVKDALPMMEIAHKEGVKTVLSTICWYNWQSAWHTHTDFKRRSLSVLRHAAKVFTPWIPSERKRMIEIADALVPNSESEAEQIRRFFGRKHGIYVVPNGVDESFDKHLNYPSKVVPNTVLCVGRIEPRKNQLNMIRALKGTGVNLAFVGDGVSQYKDYYDQCRKEGDWCVFHHGVNHDSNFLRETYASADVFLLASWLETPGLAALEAALAGCKVVITEHGSTQEYFKDMVSYVDPSNLLEIRHSVLMALEAESDNDLKNHVLENYTWDKVAKRTMEVYKYVLME